MLTTTLVAAMAFGGRLVPGLAPSVAPPPQDAAPGDPSPLEDASTLPPRAAAPADPTNEALLRELEAMRARMAEMESKIGELSAEQERQRESTQTTAASDAPEVEDAYDLEVSTKTPSQKPERVRPQPVTFDEWTAGNAMATRVTFAFADDNLLAGPADRSPQPGFNLPDDELFFENLTQEKRGYETETQLVVYKRMPSYFRRLDAEAALVCVGGEQAGPAGAIMQQQRVVCGAPGAPAGLRRAERPGPVLPAGDLAGRMAAPGARGAFRQQVAIALIRRGGRGGKVPRLHDQLDVDIQRGQRFIDGDVLLRL